MKIFLFSKKLVTLQRSLKPEKSKSGWELLTKSKDNLTFLAGTPNQKLRTPNFF